MKKIDQILMAKLELESQSIAGVIFIFNRVVHGERDREFEIVQLSQMEKEKILSEQRSFHEYLEKGAERAFQGKFEAQKRLSEAQAEIDSREWERRNADVALCETSRQLESQENGALSGEPID